VNLKHNIINCIEEYLGEKIISNTSVGGGCIADSKKITTESRRYYFLKVNEGFPQDMFQKEANGIKELRGCGVIRVPEVILANSDFILMENIEEAPRQKSFFEDFGRKFALLHKHKNIAFGFYEDNYIGSTEQKNIPSENQKVNWVEFFFNKRLLFQYQLAEKNGYATPELRKGIVMLEKNIGSILSGSEEEPALLHGDLWGGNYITDDKGEACLIDPAVYYGHREADFAMTKLFGGFSSGFYNSYIEEYPLLEGWQYRENIYKLYHVLNHLNLFGMSYYGQAVRLMSCYE